MELINYFYSFICMAGLIGNLLAFSIFSRNKFQNTIFSTYYRVLLLMDLFVILTKLELIIYINQLPTFRIISSLTCKITTYLIYLNPAISAWILVLISVDRFLSIYMPGKFLFRKQIKNQLMACLIVTIYNCIIFIPAIVSSGLRLNLSNTNNNTINCHKGDLVHLNDLIELINSILITFIIMILCTIFTILAIFKSRNKSSSSSNQAKRDIRFAIVSIALNISFFVLTFPQDFYVLIDFILSLKVDNHAFLILSMLKTFHFGTTFYLTIILNQTFRNEFFNLIKEVRSKIDKSIQN